MKLFDNFKQLFKKAEVESKTKTYHVDYTPTEKKTVHGKPSRNQGRIHNLTRRRRAKNRIARVSRRVSRRRAA